MDSHCSIYSTSEYDMQVCLSSSRHLPMHPPPGRESNTKPSSTKFNHPRQNPPRPNPYAMSSTASQPSRLTVWLYRSLALGSTAAVASHTLPLMQQSSLTNSIQLARSDEAFLSRSGIRRIAAAAKQEAKRKTLLENGAMCALSEVASRGNADLADAALGAAATLARDEPACLLRQRGLRDALLTECREGCQAAWDTLGVGKSAEEREEFMRRFEGAG